MLMQSLKSSILFLRVWVGFQSTFDEIEKNALDGCSGIEDERLQAQKSQRDTVDTPRIPGPWLGA